MILCNALVSAHAVEIRSASGSLVYEAALGAHPEHRPSDVLGWTQLEAGAAGPGGYGEAVARGEAKLCGQGADGEPFVV